MSYQARGTIQCVKCGEREAIGRKLCRPCYNEARSNGTLKNFPILGPEDVFESRIDKSGICWEWTGTKHQYGYGIFLMPGERPVRAHRYSWEHFRGPIPDGMIVMHLCDNPICVNPFHLRLGTKADNNRDTGQKRRHHYGTDHWNGRLTDADVERIRKSEKRNSELAKEFGVSPSHISRIRSGESRK